MQLGRAQPVLLAGRLCTISTVCVLGADLGRTAPTACSLCKISGQIYTGSHPVSLTPFLCTKLYFCKFIQIYAALQSASFHSEEAGRDSDLTLVLKEYNLTHIRGATSTLY